MNEQDRTGHHNHEMTGNAENELTQNTHTGRSDC